MLQFQCYFTWVGLLWPDSPKIFVWPLVMTSLVTWYWEAEFLSFCCLKSYSEEKTLTAKVARCQNILPCLLITEFLVSENGLLRRPGEVGRLCSFQHKFLCTWIKTNGYKSAISSHTALKSGEQALKLFKGKKGRSDVCVVLTMNLCALELKQTLISMLFQVIRLWS